MPKNLKKPKQHRKRGQHYNRPEHREPGEWGTVQRSEENYGQGCCEPNYAELYDKIANAPMATRDIATFILQPEVKG